jgi:catalase
MTKAQQQELVENTARAMGDAEAHIKQRHIANCAKADPAYGKGVADALAKLARATGLRNPVGEAAE